MAEHNGEWVPLAEIPSNMGVPILKPKSKSLISAWRNLACKVAVKVFTALIGERYITIEPDKGEYAIVFKEKKK